MVIVNELERDFDSNKSMVDTCNQAMADKDYSLAGKMAKELAQYIYPKRKAIEYISEELDLPPMEITVQYVDEPKPLPNLLNLK
jgi:hypothetical protein